ncbi:4,5-DOPA dioxygenase extradiol [Nitrospina watsonii]|uniref:4,5-DOPA dioxygenase extradiol n=1 Tax=Nitrospina watsonii TaxID=1323948 RepID=A0ABM9HBN9_9BACT|nr:4,5-DOPA dioxygenase extradiol [Nitrospina watsonii]CAI2717576.1 4,5-DOPA dioxygenase extradiol [Nitrospina watsonii]
MNKTTNPRQSRLPALFLGHGSPMNVIEKNPFGIGWELLGKSLAKPRAILSISAHWETNGTYVTAMQQPRTIHDFGNFPQALHEFQYPAPGSPELANRIQSLVTRTTVLPDLAWGLDHGTWSVLSWMFPQADIPVVQLSLNRNLSPQGHYEIGRELKPLREEGVLILGSGNIVHNLDFFDPNPSTSPYPWAASFDESIKQFLLKNDHESILNFDHLGETARLSVPTPEHFLPLIYIIAMQDKTERITFPVEGVVAGAASMRGAMIS